MQVLYNEFCFLQGVFSFLVKIFLMSDFTIQLCALIANSFPLILTLLDSFFQERLPCDTPYAVLFWEFSVV